MSHSSNTKFTLAVGRRTLLRLAFCGGTWIPIRSHGQPADSESGDDVEYNYEDERRRQELVDHLSDDRWAAREELIRLRELNSLRSTSGASSTADTRASSVSEAEAFLTATRAVQQALGSLTEAGRRNYLSAAPEIGDAASLSESGPGRVARISGSGSGLRADQAPAKPWGSYLPGTSAGEQAAQYWADMHVKTGNPLYVVPGLLASLWTPDTAMHTAVTLGTAGLGVVRAIPGGIAIGWRNTIGIWAHTYKHGGGGINFFVRGSRVLAVDKHAFKLNGEMVNRLHIHRGLNQSAQKMHRPYQGGW